MQVLLLSKQLALVCHLIQEKLRSFAMYSNRRNPVLRVQSISDSDNSPRALYSRVRLTYIHTCKTNTSERALLIVQSLPMHNSGNPFWSNFMRVNTHVRTRTGAWEHMGLGLNFKAKTQNNATI